jgi:hypothetical protein
MKEVIYYNDPSDPRFGTTEEVEHPDPPFVPPPASPSKADLLAQIQALLIAVQALD